MGRDWTKRVYGPDALILYNEYDVEPHARATKTCEDSFAAPPREQSKSGDSNRASPYPKEDHAMKEIPESPTTVSWTRSAPTWVTTTIRTPTRLGRGDAQRLLFSSCLFCQCAGMDRDIGTGADERWGRVPIRGPSTGVHNRPR
jgi:hypothetical protein